MRPYIIITGLIFTLVSLGHLLRLIFGWSIVIGPFTIPIWLS